MWAGHKTAGGMEGTLELGTQTALGVGGGACKREEWRQEERGREGDLISGVAPRNGDSLRMRGQVMEDREEALTWTWSQADGDVGERGQESRESRAAWARVVRTVTSQHPAGRTVVSSEGPSLGLNDLYSPDTSGTWHRW